MEQILPNVSSLLIKIGAIIALILGLLARALKNLKRDIQSPSDLLQLLFRRDEVPALNA
jgi:hypothetical protein